MKKFIDIIRENYPVTRKMSDVYAHSFINTIEEHQLTEMLGTVNHNTIPKLIGKLPGVIDVSVSNDKPFGKQISPGIEIHIDNPFKNVDIVTNKMEKLGWFPSFIKLRSGRGEKYDNIKRVLSNLDRYDTLKIRYEAKYDEQINVKSNLYHVTTDLHYTQIKRIGLTPKSQSKLANHPGRIYLLQRYDEHEIFEIGGQLLNNYKNRHLVKSIGVLEIDIGQLKKHKFYEDPNYWMSQAVYTYQNIPPVAITMVDRIDVV